MSKQEQTSFLVKLFGGFFCAFCLFLAIVSSPESGDPIPSTPSSSYTSNYGTSSEKLGGASNPFTQVDGYNEEDALIYALLKAEGYSHEEAAIATMKSAW